MAAYVDGSLMKVQNNITLDDIFQLGAKCAMVMHLTYNRQTLIKLLKETGPVWGSICGKKYNIPTPEHVANQKDFDESKLPNLLPTAIKLS